MSSFRYQTPGMNPLSRNDLASTPSGATATEFQLADRAFSLGKQGRHLEAYQLLQRALNQIPETHEMHENWWGAMLYAGHAAGLHPEQIQPLSPSM